LKKIVFWVMLSLLFVSTISGTDAKAKTYHWRIGFCTSKGSVRDVAAQAFKKYVEKESKGQIKIDIYPDGVLGSDQEMVEAVQGGALEFKMAGAGSMTNIMPECTATHAAFILNNYDEAHAMLDGPVGEQLKKVARKHGFKLLSFFDLGFAQITNNVRPIRSADDLKGLKIRCPNQPQSIATFQALGTAVSSVDFSEIYLALSQNVVDGQFNPISTIYEMKFYEVQDYLAITNLFFYHGNFIMNIKLWNRLDSKLQNIIQKGALRAEKASRDFMEASDAELLKKMKKEFKEITYPKLDSFRVKITPVYKEYEKMAGKEMMNLVLGFIKEYRQKK
jgi:tripartite ATP-independent transporter DctP family solute receptor